MCRMTTGITNLGKSNALNLNMESDFRLNDSFISTGYSLLYQSPEKHRLRINFTEMSQPRQLPIGFVKNKG